MKPNPTITFTPDMIENVMLAAGLVGISVGYGHGSGARFGKDERIVGFFYRNAEAQEANVLPAEAIAATRDLILTLANMLRDDGAIVEEMR